MSITPLSANGPPAPRLPAAEGQESRRLPLGALGVGAIALVVCVPGAFFDPTQFFSAYLSAYIFWLGIGLGSLVLLMVYHLTGGAWGFLVRRTLEASARTLPLLAVLFIPIACGVGYLYLWARPGAAEVYEGLRHKQIYLNVPFFIGRAVFYFAVWSLIAYLLDRWSQAEDRTGDPRCRLWMRRLSGLGLLIYGVTFTFAAVDWIMSLEPAFHSTIFGPLVASTELLSAHAFTLLVLTRLARRPPTAEYVSPDVGRDLGNLLLTFLILWGYMVLFQFVLIWIADMRYEVIWYLPRGRGGWLWVAWALFLIGFVAPFFALLMRDVKAHLSALEKVAGLILFMQLVFAFYQVMPAFNLELEGFGRHWMAFLTPFAVGGLWLAGFFWQLGRRQPLPLHDPSRASAAHLREVDAEEAHEEQEAVHA